MSDALEIAVLGAGAMGSLFGGRLALAGHRVRLLTTNQRHIDAVNADGLKLDLDEGSRCASLAAARPGSPGPVPQVIVVFTKTYRTAVALQSAGALIGDDTWLFSVQNGLGNLERLAPFAPRQRIIIGTTNLPADFTAPGHVTSHGASITRFALATGDEDPFVERLAEALSGAGIPSVQDRDIDRVIWEKAAFNVAMNPILALGQASPGTLGSCQPALDLALAAASEACAVANAAGVGVDESGVHETIRWACANHPHHKPSMRQDVEAGRPTEIDALCGEVSRRAGAAGLAAPVNDMLWRLVTLRDSA